MHFFGVSIAYYNCLIFSQPILGRGSYYTCRQRPVASLQVGIKRAKTICLLLNFQIQDQLSFCLLPSLQEALFKSIKFSSLKEHEKATNTPIEN
jgi:hypothetical protein